MNSNIFVPLLSNSLSIYSPHATETLARGGQQYIQLCQMTKGWFPYINWQNLHFLQFRLKLYKRDSYLLIMV